MRMAEKSTEMKRRKLNEDDFSMEISSDDPDDIENLWTTLPPEIVCMVLYWLPYETIAQLAQECDDCESMFRRLAVLSYMGVVEAKRKWKAWDWERLSGLEEAFRNMVLSMKLKLHFAFNCLETWRMGRAAEGFFTKDNYVLIGQALDYAERSHRDMIAVVHLIQASYRDIQTINPS